MLAICPRYALGLSATLARKDGLTKVLLWHVGEVAYARGRGPEAVDVRALRFASDDPAYCEELFVAGGREQPNTSAMINNICAFPPRVAALVAEARRVLAAEPGRRILVLCDRKAMLRALAEGLAGAGIDSGFYYGGLKPEVLERSAGETVVLATFAMSAEGLDIPALNTLMLASPMTEIEQSVGRILRCERQRPALVPLVIDVVDAFSVFAAQARKRRRFYRKHGYAVCDGELRPLGGGRRPAAAGAGGGGGGPAGPPGSPGIVFSRCLIEDDGDGERP